MQTRDKMERKMNVELIRPELQEVRVVGRGKWKRLKWNQ